MRATAASLTSFKVAVARRSTTLSRLQYVGIHSQTHRTASFTPFESRFTEDFIESFLFGCLLDFLGARHDQRIHGRTDLVTLNNSSGGAQIFDACIRTRSDKG